MTAPTLTVRDLETVFMTESGTVPIVRGVSFEVSAGETLGLVGESGCGKTITALSLMRLLPSGARIAQGAVQIAGVDMLSATKRQLQKIRGPRIAMVFQDSMTSLNPVLSVGLQITETLRTHLGLPRRQALARAVALLEEVGVSEPKRRLRQFPHQLSGGLRQRVAIAIALAANPQVLIADEPTTALDVTVQAQVLELLRAEQRERDMALVLITHDLGVVAGIADKIAVMYAGRIVERGAAEGVFGDPHHPYTQALLRSVPRLDGEVSDRLAAIPGAPPFPGSDTVGCSFRPRCPLAFERCEHEEPPLSATAPSRSAACWAARVRQGVR